MEQPKQDWLIGQTVGNYVVKKKLGEGGMGSVFLAEHPLIGKKVAIKTLHPEFAANEDIVSRFFNEAKAVNDIQHPNIVDIVDYGVIPGDPTRPQTVYFVMEHLDGESLADLIEREAPLPAARAMNIAMQIGDALQASHSKGIVHRDLKPDNVILVRGRRQKDFVKVLDFGIAKLTGGQAGSSRTRTGVVMGTPSYMSPEQCEGRGNTDHRTDVYALGILLYELLTGRVPFQGEGYGEILVKHLTQAPTPLTELLPDIPQPVNDVCLHALSKKPGERFPTMLEFGNALANPEAFKTGELRPVAFDGTQIQGSVPQAVKNITMSNAAGETEMLVGGPRSRAGIIIGAVCGLAILGGGAYLLFAGSGDGDSDSVAATQPEDTPAAQEPVAKPKKTPAVKTPAVVIEAPKVDMVAIRVESNPVGAQVTVTGESEPRGVTPLDLEFKKGVPVEITLAADGYQSRSRKLGSKRDRTLDIELRKKREPRKPRKPRGHKRGRSGEGDDIMSPNFD